MPKRLCVKLDYPKCGQTEVWWFITLPPSHQSLRPLPAPRPTSVAEVRVMGVGDRWGISHVIPVLKGVSPSPLRLTGTIPFPSLGWNEWTPFLGAPLFPHEISDVQQMHGKIRQAIMAIKSSKIFVRLQILPSADDFGHEYGDVWSVWWSFCQLTSQ